MNLNELKKLAEAATPGPWWSDQCEPADGHALAWIGNYFVDCDGGQRNYREQLDDAAFIAAANPQMIQRMIGCMEVMATALESTETEMRYAGFSQYQSDNAMRKQVHEEAVKALAAFNELNSEV